MRLSCRQLAAFFFAFALLGGVFFSQTKSVFAAGADKIGTHLIEGDIGAQINVINKLVSSGAVSAASGSYPIVVMIDPGHPQDIARIKTAVGSNNFTVILRINVHADTNTDSGVAGALVDAIRKSFSGKNYPVVVGNEINNQEAEWKSSNYAKYGNFFNAVCGALKNDGNPCGIAALDTINGEYSVVGHGTKASDLLSAILSSVNKSLITAVFANVYETGCGSDRCSTNGGQWILGEMKKNSVSASALYITEFGKTTCGDFDCLQDFYEQNNDISALAVVGFARDPKGAKDNSDWYHTVPAICEYWHHGPGLAVEKPSKCGGGKRSAFVYPGIEDMSPSTDKMRQMSAGYTLMCGNQFKLQGVINNEDGFKNLPKEIRPDCGKDPADPACVIAGVFANVILDNTKTVIPLFRLQGAQVPNPDSPSRRFDDFEGFFGANYSKNNEIIEAADTITPLANGVARKLISQQQQCMMTKQYLQSIQQLCETEGNRSGYTYNDKLDADAMRAAATSTGPPTPKPTLPPGDCALYSKIPGAAANFDTYKKVYDTMPGTFNCTNMESNLIYSDWYKAFSKIELTTPKGFKPAYLVHYIDRPEEQPSNLTSRVNWMAPGEGDSGGIGDQRNISDRIKIVKVYVPAGFAEIDLDSVNTNSQLETQYKHPVFFPTYTGGFMQTITSILPVEIQSKIARQRAIITQGITRLMQSSNIFKPGENGIECQTCEKQPQEDPRTMIVRRINAGLQKQFDKDGVTILQDSTACTSDDLIGEHAVEKFHTINPAGTLDPVKPAKITASATMIATRGQGGKAQETIRTYLLLPEEYRNISDYELPFLQAFLPFDVQDITKHPEFRFITTATDHRTYPGAAYKYLQLSGSSADMVSPTIDKDPFVYYETDNDAQPVYDPITGLPSQPQKRKEVKISGQITADRGVSEIRPDPQVPGGILARTLWEIMCNVTQPNDNTPTIPYPGFEKFLQKGVAACTDGAQPASNPSTPIAAGSCNYGDAAVTAAIQSAATKYSVPAEMLLAIYQTEGLDYRIDPKNYVCKENWATAAGVTQVTKGTYNIVTCPDERLENDLASCQATSGKLSRCDVNSAFELAARTLLLKAGHWIYGVCDGTQRNTAPIARSNISEVYIAASYYYGSCNPDNLTGNFSKGALQRGDILACRDGDCKNMGYGDFICAFMAKQNGLNYCNRPDNFPSRANCKF